jgi:hypothetical protein
VSERETLRLVYGVFDWGSLEVNDAENVRLCELLQSRLEVTASEYDWRVIAAQGGIDPSHYQSDRDEYLADLGVMPAIEEAWEYAIEKMDAWEVYKK